MTGSRATQPQLAGSSLRTSIALHLLVNLFKTGKGRSGREECGQIARRSRQECSYESRAGALLTHPGLERLRPRAGCRESAVASKSLSSFFCASYSVFDSRASVTKGSRAASSRELHAALASAMVIVPSTLLQYAVREVKGAVGRTGGGGEVSAASIWVTTSASCRRTVRGTAVVVARRSLACGQPVVWVGSSPVRNLPVNRSKRAQRQPFSTWGTYEEASNLRRQPCVGSRDTAVGCKEGVLDD